METPQDKNNESGLYAYLASQKIQEVSHIEYYIDNLSTDNLYSSANIKPEHIPRIVELFLKNLNYILIILYLLFLELTVIKLNLIFELLIVFLMHLY